MTVINYTLTRNIAPAVNFTAVVDAVDISFASADNSINSVTTDLSGLLAGEWVYVVGSTTAENPGWHQLAADSTTNKITINTDTTLVDELAGASISIDGYLNGFGEQINLETAARTLDQSSVATTRRAESISGVIETLLHREIEYWNIVTGFITEADLPRWKQFFSSVRAGEVFLLDPYGTVASPGTTINCTLDGDPAYARIETTDIYTLSFKARVQ